MTPDLHRERKAARERRATVIAGMKNVLGVRKYSNPTMEVIQSCSS